MLRRGSKEETWRRDAPELGLFSTSSLGFHRRWSLVAPFENGFAFPNVFSFAHHPLTSSLSNQKRPQEKVIVRSSARKRTKNGAVRLECCGQTPFYSPLQFCFVGEISLLLFLLGTEPPSLRSLVLLFAYFSLEKEKVQKRESADGKAEFELMPLRRPEIEREREDEVGQTSPPLERMGFLVLSRSPRMRNKTHPSSPLSTAPSALSPPPHTHPPTQTTKNSRRNLSVAALALVALTAFAGSVFAADSSSSSATPSGGAPPADASATKMADAAKVSAAMEAENRELDRQDAGLDANKAAAAVDPDHLLSHAEMDAMMRDAGFALNRDTGLYDPPAGADKSQLSRQVLLPDSGADHAAFANVLLDQQHKFIQVEHGEFSLPAGEFLFGFWFFLFDEEKEEEKNTLSFLLAFSLSLWRKRRGALLLSTISCSRLTAFLIALASARETGVGMRKKTRLKLTLFFFSFPSKKNFKGVTFLVKEYQQLLADALAITGISQPAVELDWLTQHVQYKIQEFNTLLVSKEKSFLLFFSDGKKTKKKTHTFFLSLFNLQHP